MNKELEKELSKCDDIFDFEDIIVKYAFEEDIDTLKDILNYLKDNPKKKEILGHSLQSLSQEKKLPVKSVKLILENELDHWQLGVALRNLSKITLSVEIKVKANALSLIKHILKQNNELAKEVDTFHKCCFQGSHQVVSVFLENGADEIINEINDNNTALLKAIRSKDLKKVKILVEKGADVNLKKDYTKKPLEYAMEQKAVKIAEYLESKGAGLTSDNELTAYEMINAEKYDLLEKLVAEGKDGDIPHALMYAVNRKKVKCAEILLGDENYEFKPKDLSEALYNACQDLKGKDRVKIAKMLIERGADIKAEILYTPLIEKLRECSDIMDLLKNSSMLKELENSEVRIEEASEELCEFLLNNINNEKKKTLNISFDVVDDMNEEMKPWSSSLGGKPYFDEKMEYPLLKSGEPMPFFGQINFGELPEGLFENQPDKGLLQIYVDAVYSNEERFIFIEDVVSDISSLIDPPEFKPLLKNRYKFDFDSKITTTNPYPKDKKYYELYKKVAGIVLGDFDDDQLEKIEDNVFEVISEQDSNSGHQMGGYVYFTQEDPRYGDKKNYINLVQIDELDGKGDSFFWGDSGLGHIFVRPEAFKTLDFSDSMFHFDCY